MKRILESLNEMSFDLPQGWKLCKDKYKLTNGQGFINTENYLSDDGKVISLFEIHREPDEFFDYFQNIAEGYNEKRDGMMLVKQFSISANDFSFPVYILKATKQENLFIVHVFVNCGDCLGCFIFNIDSLDDDNKKTISSNATFSAVSQILRTVQ